MTGLGPPVDFRRWTEEHEHLLQPPVNNLCVQLGRDFIIMAVGGPNERSDYHINQTEVEDALRTDRVSSSSFSRSGSTK